MPMLATVLLQRQRAPRSVVSSVPRGLLQRKCACGAAHAGGEECAECRNKRQLQRKAATAASPGTVPPIVNDVLQSPGQPLDAATRAFMEPRFGHDFSHIRVHTDANAAESARTVSASAYTVGAHIAFDGDQYRPTTDAGMRLLAHELVHTVQQQNGPAEQVHSELIVTDANDQFEQEADRIAGVIAEGEVGPVKERCGHRWTMQRKCGRSLGAPIPDCAPGSTDASGEVFYFHVNCDDPTAEAAARLKSYAAALPTGAIVNVHGYASEEGPPRFNVALSCHRANKVANLIAGIAPSANIATFKHGARAGVPRFYWRSAVVETPKTCGPDATAWFITQVSAAKQDPIVLAIQSNLAGAHRLAARFGFSAERVAEGGIAKQVFAEEARAGSPARTPEATQQLAASTAGQTEFGRAFAAATAPIPFVGAPEQMVLLAIRRAALAWKAQVGTGKRYDFKSDPATLGTPRSPHCPVNCSGTITLCPGLGGGCFEKDAPGNLFYAHVGRFVGWTELSLQLGSEFAQLQKTKTWDPPEDPRMISTGFALPDPLTEAGLCAALAANRSAFVASTCPVCSELTTASLR